MIRRRWMGFSALATGGTLLVVCGSGVAASIHARITVKPRRGTPKTSFSVRFRAPVATGSLRTVRREYVLSFAVPTRAAGCVTEGSLELPASRVHAHVRVTLRPRRFGGVRWCPGAVHGRVEVVEAPRCPPRELCPALVVRVGTVGTFTFHVRPPGGDVAPPRFAGLSRAAACTAGAQPPGAKTAAWLSWSAATDNRTPAPRLVYDVFMTTTPGTENFLRPTWTSAPGATSFRTPGLAGHGPEYFVVRARDRAGNEDRNKVERRLIDLCL